MELINQAFMPHGHCFLWRPDIVWFHVFSDSVIAISYVMIPLLLMLFVKKRNDVPQKGVFLLFGAFIFFCGITHIFDIWTIWEPVYIVEGAVKAVTALISITTAFVLVQTIPKVLSLRSPDDLEKINKKLEKEIEMRKRIEQELRKVIKERELILNSAGEGIYGLDNQGRTTFVNPSAAYMLGWDTEELIGRKQHDVIHHTRKDGSPYPGEDCPIYAAFRDGAIHTENDEVFWNKDGGSIEVEYTSTPIIDHDEGVVGAVVTFRDISLRKKMEDELRESEERFRGAFENSAIGMSLVSTKGEWLKVNRSLCNILGYREEELLETDFQTLTHPDDLDKDLQLVHQMLDGEIKTYNMEKRYYKKNGDLVWALLNVSMVSDSEHRPLHFVSQIQDITQQKKYQEELGETLLQLESKNSFLSVINEVINLVHSSIDIDVVMQNTVKVLNDNIKDVDIIGIYVREGEKLVLKSQVGYSEEFLGRASVIPEPKGYLWGAVLQKKSIYCKDTQDDNLIEEDEKAAGIRSYYSFPLFFEGKVTGVLSVNSYYEDSLSRDEIILMESVVDQIEVAMRNAYQAEQLRFKARQLASSNSELEKAYKQLERQSEQLIQSEKMSTIGTLAAGMAHELNNPLMVILLSTQYLLEKTGPGDKQYEILRKVEDATVHSGNIVESLLTYSRDDKNEQENISSKDIEQIIDMTLNIISHRIKSEEINVERYVEENIRDIRISATDLQQILMNLVTNSIDAVANLELREILVKFSLADESLKLMVKDTGCGISEDNRKKIFDPFFTTKPTGQGTGLGLSVTRNIVDKYNGEFYFSSSDGNGTTFEIYFPVKG